MDCQTVRRYLAMYLDSELGPETTFEISSHLEECDNCRRVAGQEGHLEDRLRSVLRAPRPEDEAIWKRSVAHIRRSRSGRRTPVVMIGIAGLATAAAAAVILLFGAPWVHDELDLAEVTAAEHTLALSKDGRATGEVRTTGELDAYFRRELSPAYCLSIDPSGSTQFIGAGVCEVSDVPAAHIVCANSAETVSLFWFPSEGLASFPETVSRFQEHGSSFHCRVAPFEFFAKRLDTGILVGIGDTTPERLESLVAEAAGGCESRN